MQTLKTGSACLKIEYDNTIRYYDNNKLFFLSVFLGIQTQIAKNVCRKCRK